MPTLPISTPDKGSLVVYGPIIPDFTDEACLAKEYGAYRFFKVNDKFHEAALRAAGALRISIYEGVGYVAYEKDKDSSLRSQLVDWITCEEWGAGREVIATKKQQEIQAKIARAEKFIADVEKGISDGKIDADLAGTGLANQKRNVGKLKIRLPNMKADSDLRARIDFLKRIEDGHLPRAMRSAAKHALHDFEHRHVWAVDPDRRYWLVYGEKALVGANYGGNFGEKFPEYPMGQIWLEQACAPS